MQLQPGMTGLQICRAVCGTGGAPADPHRPEILLLSASVQPEAVQVGLDAGAHSYIAKPFSPRALAQRLAQVAGARRSAP